MAKLQKSIFKTILFILLTLSICSIILILLPTTLINNIFNTNLNEIIVHR